MLKFGVLAWDAPLHVEKLDLLPSLPALGFEWWVYEMNAFDFFYHCLGKIASMTFCVKHRAL